MELSRYRNSVFERTETMLEDVKLRRDIKQRLMYTVHSIEEIEYMTEKEIYDLVSKDITDKMFAALMAVVLDYQAEDTKKCIIGRKHIDFDKTFDAIANDLLHYREEDKLYKAGIRKEEINSLMAEERYSAQKASDVHISNFGLSLIAHNSLFRANIKTIGDILIDTKRIKDCKGIGKKTFDEIMSTVQNTIDWYQAHPITEISTERKEECLDALIDQICEGMDRRYVRAYLRSIKVNDCTVSYIVKTKFPDKKSQFVALSAQQIKRVC